MIFGRFVKSRRMRWEVHVERLVTKNACKLLIGKSQKKRPLGRPRRIQKDNIKKVEYEGVEWTELFHDRAL
jgi:hypothetical protein